MSQHSLASQLAETLADGGWRSKARPSQLAPEGDWNGWLVIAGASLSQVVGVRAVTQKEGVVEVSVGSGEYRFLTRPA